MENANAKTETLAYYDANAQAFESDTAEVEFSQVQDKFLGLLPESGRVLDFGCGSGRDAKYFRKRGFNVEAIDGSEEMCRIATKRAGIPVRQMTFDQLDAQSAYDGVWACSSILHVPRAQLPGILGRMRDALVTGGVLYTSFKHGDFEGMRNGRYFTNFTEETFREMLAGVPGLVLEDLWVTGDVRPGRQDELWLNLILRKDA